MLIYGSEVLNIMKEQMCSWKRAVQIYKQLNS